MKKIFLAAILSISFFLIFSFAGWQVSGFLFGQNKNGFPFKTTIYAPKENDSIINQEKENFCPAEFTSNNESDNKFCQQKPKIFESRGVEIDLTNKKVLLYDTGKVVQVLNVAYQSPEGKWFQTPTGYFKIGVKRESHVSSLFPVTMPYSVQFYEDFFIHEIPSYLNNGEKVSSNFSGGCIRLEKKDAKKFYDFAQKNDRILIYKTLNDLTIKNLFFPPVDLKNFWIRQRFNNPIRQFWNHGGDLDNLKYDYYQHTGVDFAPTQGIQNIPAYAIFDGKVAKIQLNDKTDHGLGNTIILEHEINGGKIYSLYAHLALINVKLKEGVFVDKGEIIGEIGNSGFGCKNYWRIGADGCDKNSPNDTHLHLEIKDAPVIENPLKGMVCETFDYKPRYCYGYTPDYPQKYGYRDPIEFLFNKND